MEEKVEKKTETKTEQETQKPQDQSALTQLPSQFEPKNPEGKTEPEKASVPAPKTESKPEPKAATKKPKAKKVQPKAKKPQAKKATKKPASKPKAEKKPKASKPKVKVERHKADLGAGYQISQRRNSAYGIFVKGLADMSKLNETVPMLEALDPKDYDASKKVIGLLFAKAEDVYKISATKEFREYGRKKFGVMSKAGEKDAEMRKYIKKTERIDDGVWVGDIKEIANTCKASYTSKNRNVKKFHQAGVIVRQYPLRPKEGEQIFLSLFPSKFVKKVSEALRTIGTKDGRDMKDEVLPKIWR